MKTEEFIKFRNLLQSHAGLYNVDARISEVCRLLQTTVDSTESTLLEQDAIYNFQDRYRSFLPKIDAIIADIGAYTANIDTIIDEQGKTEELDTSTQFKYGTPERFCVTDEINHLVKTSILKYVDWHYPTLQFGCRFNGIIPSDAPQPRKSLGHIQNEVISFLDFDDGLTGGEPFYVCDFDQAAMTNCISRFNPVFRQKICDYKIDSHDLSSLPQEQFGFIFSWHIFNYATLETVELYLAELQKLLRPGGTIMFSYNNCDIPESATLLPMLRGSFVPKRKLFAICEKLGFMVTASHDIQNTADKIPYAYVSWVELTTAGVLSTTKAHSALGKIEVTY